MQQIGRVEQGMAQRVAEVEAARVPGTGAWQVIDLWDEVTTLDVDGKPMTVYPQQHALRRRASSPWSIGGKGCAGVTEEEVQDAITLDDWWTSGPSGGLRRCPTRPGRRSRPPCPARPVGTASGRTAAICRGRPRMAASRWAAVLALRLRLGRNRTLPVVCPRRIGRRFGRSTPLTAGRGKFADLSDEEWGLMSVVGNGGGFNYPKTYVGWPDWAIERREKRVDYDGWVRGKSPWKMPVVRPFNPNASEVDLGRTARISTGDLSAALQSTHQKRGVYATERTQIDVVQQPNGQYVVVTHDGMFVRAYVMDDVRPELLKTDKVTTLKKGQALGIGVESPFERTAWMGEHGIMNSIGAELLAMLRRGRRGARQEGYLPKTSRARRRALRVLLGKPVEDEEELTPIQRLQGTTGEQEPPAADRSLTPGQRLRLKNLGYSDDQMIVMTPERRAEVLREGY